MGALLSHLVARLLGDRRPHDEGTHEIDHNVLVCCGNLTVAEREKGAEEERVDAHGDEDHIRG